MDGAESPRKSFLARNRTAAILIIAIIIAGFLFYGYFYGYESFVNTWSEVRALTAKTIRDVLGSGSRGELAAEIDLAVPAASSSDGREQNSSSLDVPEDSSGADAVKKIPAEINYPPPLAENKKSFSASDTAAVASSAVKNNFTAPTCDFVPANGSPSFVRIGDGPTHQVLLNEIAWMGSVPLAGQIDSSENSTQAGNREWMELRNNNGALVDLSGWQIINQSEKIKILFGAGERIDFGELLLLERGDDGAVPGITAQKIYSGTLSNSGEWLRLFDSGCRLIDEINASAGWPGGNNSTKATLERDLMDPDWHTSGFPGGTPKAANSVVWKATTPQQSPPQIFVSGGSAAEANSVGTSVSGSFAEAPAATPEATPSSSGTSLLSAAPSHLLIAAAQIAGASSAEDLIKVFNPTAAVIDMGGWKLRKRTSSGSEYSIRVLPAGSTIQAQNYFTWANSANAFASSIGADASSSETLAADNSIALEDASGTIVDALAWGSGLTNPFVEGAPYPTSPPANQIISRKFISGIIQDTDDNSQDFELR